eukprot:Hpha_TRINITY_DN14976_c0_g1::TRINITY_DN14976_c0_g1_i5::g.143231::m.143231
MFETGDRSPGEQVRLLKERLEQDLQRAKDGKGLWEGDTPPDWNGEEGEEGYGLVGDESECAPVYATGCAPGFYGSESPTFSGESGEDRPQQNPLSLPLQPGQRHAPVPQSPLRHRSSSVSPSLRHPTDSLHPPDLLRELHLAREREGELKGELMKRDLRIGELVRILEQAKAEIEKRRREGQMLRVENRALREEHTRMVIHTSGVGVVAPGCDSDSSDADEHRAPAPARPSASFTSSVGRSRPPSITRRAPFAAVGYAAREAAAAAIRSASAPPPPTATEHPSSSPVPSPLPAPLPSSERGVRFDPSASDAVFLSVGDTPLGVTAAVPSAAAVAHAALAAARGMVEASPHADSSVADPTTPKAASRELSAPGSRTDNRKATKRSPPVSPKVVDIEQVRLMRRMRRALLPRPSREALAEEVDSRVKELRREWRKEGRELPLRREAAGVYSMEGTCRERRRWTLSVVDGVLVVRQGAGYRPLLEMMAARGRVRDMPAK